MLKRALKSDKIKIAIPIVVLSILLIGLFVLFNQASKRRYEEQVARAESYLEAESYQEAIESYNKALRMNKDKWDEDVIIALAEAYAGNYNYDKALETLREYYIRSDSVLLKEKIVDISYQKLDYEYQQVISRGNKFFSNEEYDKAIDEYEKAKTIKGRETISYQKIAESYVAKGDYERAYKEITDGIVLTQNENLKKTLSRLEVELGLLQYNKCIEEGTEYIQQEKYTEGIKKYEEAIKQVPTAERAYVRLGEAYIQLEWYERTVALMQTALTNVKSERLEEILNLAMEKKEEEEKRQNFLMELFHAVNYFGFPKVEKLMQDSYFKEKIVGTAPIYYSQFGEGLISTGHIMIIYDEKSLYSGGIRDNKKKGMGIYFTLEDEEGKSGYNYYEGEWHNDYPSGSGKKVKVTNLTDDDGNLYRDEIVSSGYYRQGLENGKFHMFFYSNEKEIANVYYRAIDGIPVATKDSNGNKIEEDDQYAIGQIYKGDLMTGDYYYIPKDTVLGVFTQENIENYEEDIE